jgi:phosphatidylglycerophosphatase A
MQETGGGAKRGRLEGRLLRDPVVLLACGGGIGLVRTAPGTFGSALAVLVAFVSLPAPLAVRIAIGIALLVLGFFASGPAARRIGVKDHSGIVIDEIAAMYLVLLVVPPSIAAWTLAFCAFRLFDIWKPWPIRDLDHRLSGSAGIMLDDLAAALYAAVVSALGGWLMS